MEAGTKLAGLCAHHNGVLLRPLLDLTQVAQSQERPRGFLHQEGCHSLGSQRFLVVQVVADEIVADCQRQIPVRARADGIKIIGFRGYSRICRVDGDKPRTTLLGVHDPSHANGSAIGGIERPKHQILGVTHRAPVVATQPSSISKEARHVVVAVAVVGSVNLNGTHVLLQPGAIRIHVRAQVSAVCEKSNALVAEFLAVSLPFGRDFVKCLVPCDALPFASATRGALDTAHGILDTIGVIQAVELRKTTLADTLPLGIGQLILLNVHRLAIPHRHFVRAMPQTSTRAFAQILPHIRRLAFFFICERC